MSDANLENREFNFTDRNFATIRTIVYKSSGIKLSEHKRNMVYARLARRLRKLNVRSFDDYCAIIQQDESAEFGEFINALTTNLTSFFRENHHFEYLKNTVCPALRARLSATDLPRTNAGDKKRLRAWSAGCSTGEEPYSIAITLAGALDLSRFDAKILATDLDSNVIATAKSGIYPIERIESLAPEMKKKYFARSKDRKSVQVRASYAGLVTFKVLNLLHPWPMKGPFDFIFCRNVVIYFDKDTQRILFDRIADLLADGGYLFIGHSENLHRISGRFRSLGKTIYQKIH